MHLLGFFGQRSNRLDPAAQFVFGVEVAEALGGGDVRLLPGLGVVACDGVRPEAPDRRLRASNAGFFVNALQEDYGPQSAPP